MRLLSTNGTYNCFSKTLLPFKNIARTVQVTLWLSITSPQCNDSSFSICHCVTKSLNLRLRLRLHLCLSLFTMFFIVFHYLALSFIFFPCLSLSLLSFIAFHCLSLSFIVFHCLSLSFFVFHCLSLSFIVSYCLWLPGRLSFVCHHARNGLLTQGNGC